MRKIGVKTDIPVTAGVHASEGVPFAGEGVAGEGEEREGFAGGDVVRVGEEVGCDGNGGLTEVLVIADDS